MRLADRRETSRFPRGGSPRIAVAIALARPAELQELHSGATRASLPISRRDRDSLADSRGNGTRRGGKGGAGGRIEAFINTALSLRECALIAH